MTADPFSAWIVGFSEVSIGHTCWLLYEPIRLMPCDIVIPVACACQLAGDMHASWKGERLLVIGPNGLQAI